MEESKYKVQSSVYPEGYEITSQGFNSWARHIYNEITETYKLNRQKL